MIPLVARARNWLFLYHIDNGIIERERTFSVSSLHPWGPSWGRGPRMWVRTLRYDTLLVQETRGSEGADDQCHAGQP